MVEKVGEEGTYWGLIGEQAGDVGGGTPSHTTSGSNIKPNLPCVALTRPPTSSLSCMSSSNVTVVANAGLSEGRGGAIFFVFLTPKAFIGGEDGLDAIMVADAGRALEGGRGGRGGGKAAEAGTGTGDNKRAREIDAA